MNDTKSDKRFSHRQSFHPLYGRWRSMLTRCRYTKANNFHNYGGRGIKVCERWHNFAHFMEDIGQHWKPGLMIERVDNDGNYEPGNCIWATRKQQNSNTRTSRFLVFRGVRLTVSQWAEKLNVPYRMLRVRLFRGWSVEEALGFPKLEQSSGRRANGK